MDEHRDIYRKPESQPRRNEGPVTVEPTPAEIRARTRRSTIGFTLVMLALLGGSTWFIYIQEKETERAVQERDTLSIAALSRQTGAVPSIRFETPRTAITAPVEPSPEGEAAGINPEKMAQAMAEVRLANDYLRAREFDPAEAHARKALEVVPNMNQALRLLGVIYTQRGQFDQAIATLERALKSNLFSAETYNNLAAAYMQKGMFDKAEELLQTSLQISPDYHIACLNLGLVYIAKGQYEAAADSLERAIARVPNDPGPRNNLAVALLRTGRYDEARTQLQTVVDNNPQLPNSYFNMAITYVLEKRFDDAMAWIRRGAQHCSPMACQQFLSDNDFNSMRDQPEFKKFLDALYPEVVPPKKG
ncbi:MAG: tetratricopeptide repeat protein [Verrucomicrobiota bacterium]